MRGLPGTKNKPEFLRFIFTGSAANVETAKKRAQPLFPCRIGKEIIAVAFGGGFIAFDRPVFLQKIFFYPFGRQSFSHFLNISRFQQARIAGGAAFKILAGSKN